MFREIARKKQALSREESIGLLREQPRGVLAVQGDDGYPYAVPHNHWYCEEEGRLYFHSGRQGHKIDAIRACPKASYCVMADSPVEGAWWRQYRSVIVFGHVELVGDAEKAIEVSRRLSFQFTEDAAYIEEEIRRSGAGVLCFALVPEHITGKRVNEK